MRVLGLETSSRDVSVFLSNNVADTSATSVCHSTLLEEFGSYEKAFTSKIPENATVEPNLSSAGIIPTVATSDAKPRFTRSSQTLVRRIKDCLAHSGCQPQDVDLVAVTVGPGSFTGLRIGLVTAKTFAYSTGSHVVGVNTLDVIAAQTHFAIQASSDGISRIQVAVDAQRKQVFTADYPLADFVPLSHDFQLVGVHDWLAGINHDEIASGPVLNKIPNEIGALSPDNLAPRDSWVPKASTVAALGLGNYLGAGADDWWKLKPLYMRPSYAEE